MTPAGRAEGTRYQCPSCRQTFPLTPTRWRCGCSSHLDLAPLEGLHRHDVDSGERSLWRYRAALRVDGRPVTLGEGWTPLIESEWNGQATWFKLEFLAPSGSFKDRGSAVLVSHLVEAGVSAIGEDSSGNAGASMATYAAAAGISCHVYVPASTSPGKVVQMMAAGATVVRIDGSRQDVADAILRDTERFFYASHNWHPFFLEGTKTLGYEIWEGLGFDIPDCIVVPLGGGSSLLGCALAFRELLARGEIERVPRLYGVQAARCAPIHTAIQQGANDLVPVAAKPSVAEGIALPRPVRARAIIEALHGSGGGTVAVSESEIVSALERLARAGLFVEPTSAAAAAGLDRLRSQGTIGETETAVLVLTGTGLKAVTTIGDVLGLASRGTTG